MVQTYAPLLQHMLLEFQNHRHESAERIAESILHINSKDKIALQVLGLTLAMRGRFLESVGPLSRAVLLDNKNPEAFSNLARAQYSAGLFQDAIVTFEKLKKLSPNSPQILVDKGTAHAKLRQHDLALACYEKAIQLRHDYFLAWSNRGNVFSELGFSLKAIESYETALKLNPDYAETWTNYGNAFYDLGLYEDACLAHEKALSLHPDYAEALSNLGNALLELKRGEDALSSYQKAYDILPEHPFLLGQLIDAYGNICDWKSREQLVPIALDAISNNKSASSPFILLQTKASLEVQKAAAKIYINERLPRIEVNVSKFRRRVIGDKIRIGYFSSDFKEHPVGMLIENLLRLHDRSCFEVFGFFLNKKTGDATEKQLTQLFDKCFDLFAINDSDAHQVVLESELDIAIDLNGHTAGARTGLFARLLAPIQICYLGYAGTTGANFYQYLIADKIVIPPEHQPFYSEKIAYLPNSFFPADTLVARDDFGILPTRSLQGLPDSGIIFACFNNAYKITPEIFDVWMNLLKAVPGSILWLSKANDSAIQNLKNEALARGIESSRLVFATREPTRAGHLSRLRLADLFLDTLFFNAHTTAADALWAGVPVLTLLGNTFASRVAASLLNALGMCELITYSLEEYYRMALEIAIHPEIASSFREKLEKNRLACPLFNTCQYVIDLESLYKSMTSDLH